MKSTLRILGAGILLFISILLLNSCNSTLEKNPPQVYTVLISGMKFQPAELTVHRGDTVIWVNQDMVMHDVTEEPGKAWTSSPLPAGKSWSMAVTQSADYYCSIHQVMKGKLIVE